MPLYVYACETCGHGFEVRQSFGDTPLSVCPECTGKIRRVVQPVGILFKGSGFYKTDSRSANTAGVAAGERNAEPATASTNTEGTTPAPASTANGSTPAASPTAAAPSGSGETKSVAVPS
jgi:putative FmdB family regulatory protein